MDSTSQTRSLTKTMVLPLFFFSAAAGADITWYGQANRAALYVNDDHEAHWHFVDNAHDHASTRVGVKATYEQSNEIHVGAKIEYQLESTASNTVSQLAQNGTSGITIRHADVWFANPTWGKVSLGQGSTATDGTSESSLSGTHVISYVSSAGEMFGGYMFHQDGSASRVTAAADPTVASRLGWADGHGRTDRLRYDSPTWHGFSFAASFSNLAAERFGTDAALRYSGEFLMFQVQAAVGYAWNNKGVNDQAASSTGGTDQTLWDGSIGFLHADSGWNFAFAYENLEKASDANAAANEDATLWHVELGKQNEWIACGNTNLSLTYSRADDVSVNNDSGHTWGFGLVQHLDRANSELYLGVRSADYKTDAQAYDSMWAFMAGMRVKFSAGL